MEVTMERRSKKGEGDRALSVPVAHREIPRMLRTAVARWYDRLPDEERAKLGRGEYSGYSYVVERVLCWVLSLSDDDFDRIQREGRQLVDEVRKLDRLYEGPPPIRRREKSVLVPPRDGGGGPVGIGGTGPVKRGAKPHRADDTRRSDHAPAAIR